MPSYFKENKGGAELQCFYLAQELIKRGWDVHYIRELRDKNHQKSYISDGIKIHGITKRRNALRWMNENQLYKVMKSIEADFWYCRATISYLYPVVKNAKNIAGSKVIWSCSHDNELKSIKKNNFLAQLLWTYNRILFKRALPKVGNIILQTNRQKTLLQTTFNLSGDVIYNAHPTPQFQENKNIEDTIVWVGRLQTWKCPEKFAQIAEHFLLKSYRFVAIGKPLKNNNLEDMLKAYQEKLPNFQFKGELDNSHVCEIISKAKLLVCTSDFEGFSNTFIEAWARGVPVVSLNVDPDNLLRQEKIGLLSNSIEQVYKDIDLLMQDQEKWSELSTNCINFFNTNLTLKMAVDKLEELLL